MTNFFALRPDKNESAEHSDGRNITFRYVTLPVLYVVTAAGLVGLWRARRRRGAEFLLLQAGPGNPRLPDWDTISTNPEMRRAAQELAHLRTSLGRH